MSSLPTRSESKVQSLAPPKTTTSMYQVIQVSPPFNTPWNPQVAQQLITSLFSLSTPFKLMIQASKTAINWCIEVSRRDEKAITKSIFARYPQAQISVYPQPLQTAGYFLYHFDAAAPFIGPLQYASDFGKIDPLASLLSAISHLGDGEEIVYELSLTPPQKKYFKLGQKLSTRPMNKWWDYLSIGGTAVAVTNQTMGVTRTGRFDAAMQRIVREKLAMSLKEARLAFKIKATNRSRANEIITLIDPALALFERPGSNYLVKPQEKSFPLVLSALEVAAMWHLPSEQCQTSGINWAASAASPMPMALTSKKQGILLGNNLFQDQMEEVWLNYSDRVTHINIIGKTGVGKSTLLHQMAHQDILAGKGVGVIDPHGKLVDDILATSVPPEREEDVVLFDMSDHEYPISLNLLVAPPGLAPETVASQALAVVRKVFADSWSQTRMEDALYAAIIALMSVDGSTIQDIPKLFHDSDFRATILSEVTDPVALEFWYDEYEPLSAGQKHQFALPISNRIRKFYRNQQIRRIICQQGSLDFRDILDNGKIFLAKLGGASEIEAETLGALLISKFQVAAMSRGQSDQNTRPPYYLFVDEIQNFTTTSLATVFSEARKFDLNLVVANQFTKQLEGETLEAILGNAGTTIMFRVGPSDAPKLTPLVKPHFSSEDLMNLNRFTTVVKMQAEGETLPAFSMNTRKPLLQTDIDPNQVARIKALSRQKYGRSKDEVDAKLLERIREHRPQQQAADVEVSYFD